MSGSFPLNGWHIKPSKQNKPKELMIEVTTECNLDCIHCFRKKLREKFGTMDFDTYKKIISEAGEVGIKKIIFSGWGEPLVHPHILNFIKLAKRYEITVSLNTNGTLLYYFIDEFTKVPIDEIIVSIDATDVSMYKKIRVGGEISEVIKGLLKLSKIRRQLKKDLKVGLHFTVTKLNYRELPNVIKLANEVKANYIRLSNVVPISKDMEELACFEDRKCIEFMENYLNVVGKLSLEYNVQVIKSNFKIKAQRVCPFSMENAMYIRWDGLVTPCIHYAHNYTFFIFGVKREIKSVVFGDVKKENLISIWRKLNYSSFRFKALTGYQPSCLDCELSSYCSLTLTNTLDCWANTPTCAHCPFLYGIALCPL